MGDHRIKEHTTTCGHGQRHGCGFINEPIRNRGLHLWAMGQHGAIFSKRRHLQAAIFDRGVGDRQPNGDHIGLVGICECHSAVLVPICAADVRADFICGQLCLRWFDPHVLDRV